MGAIAEVIRLEPNGGISFGNYLVKEKQKVSDFEAGGDIYKVKTHNELTRIEKNSKLLLETVPGSTIHNFNLTDSLTVFEAEGNGDTQITLEMEPEMSYNIFVGGKKTGESKSNRSGKVSFSAELADMPQQVKIEKI
jgi:hypothetical protein